MYIEGDTLQFYKGRDFRQLSTLNDTRTNPSKPDAYFGQINANGKKLLRQSFIIQDIGTNPAIHIMNGFHYKNGTNIIY